MPTTKLYFKKVAIPGLLIVLTSFLGFLGAKSDMAIPVAIYGLAILGAGGAVVAILESVIGTIKLSSKIQKHAKLDIQKKELDFRETKQEKVILLTLTNKEWWRDADDMKIRFTDIYQTEGNESNVVKNLRRQVFNNKYRLAWIKVADQKSISVQLARKETKELFFIETNKARNEFFVKVDPRGQRNDSGMVGGFPPGKYEIDLMIRGNMAKRVVFWSLRASVFYNGGDQLYVNFET